MKYIYLILGLLLGFSAINAQKLVEREYPLKSNQSLCLEFSFGNHIEIIQWNKSVVKVNALVTINKGKDNDRFSLKHKESKKKLSIYSDYGDYFKNLNGCNNNTDIIYTVYVPKNIKLSVESISGDLISSSFTGDLDADLISGDITIKNSDGSFDLNTISGDVDIEISKGKIEAETLSGNVYSDLEFKNEAEKSMFMPNTIVRTTVNNGRNKIELSSISGDIMIREDKTN